MGRSKGEFIGIRGVDDITIINEVNFATELTYPEKEGKIYINVGTVYAYIKEHKRKFPSLISQTEKYVKALITQVYMHKGWERRTKASYKNSSIFRRGL
jgi:hypothetical protein